MAGIFHSVDLRVLGEESGARVECRSALVPPFYSILPNALDQVYIVPFESDGHTVFDTYTTYIDIAPADPFFDQYRYHLLVYRQTGKLSDTGTALGVGEYITGSHLTGPTWTGNHSMRNSTQLSAPLVLPQGSYFIMISFEFLSKPAGPALFVVADGINASSAGNTWVTESHLYGVLATSGTFPTLLTTNDAALTTLTDSFANGVDSLWLGLFYSGDATP